jgi:hypothetical protein
MIELNPNPATELPTVSLAGSTDDYLIVSVSLTDRWTVTVSQPLYDPDEPFTAADVQRLVFAATEAARRLIR